MYVLLSTTGTKYDKQQQMFSQFTFFFFAHSWLKH